MARTSETLSAFCVEGGELGERIRGDLVLNVCEWRAAISGGVRRFGGRRDRPETSARVDHDDSAIVVGFFGHASGLETSIGVGFRPHAPRAPI